MPRAGSRRRGDGSQPTRDRLVAAARTRLVEHGFAGATAREIGQEADLNPALVFYHFGTLNDLLLAALDTSSSSSLERYERALEEADGLRQMLAVARDQQGFDHSSGHVQLVAQMIAGGVVDPSLGREVARRIEPWVDLTRRAARRGLPAALQGRLPIDDLAFAIVALALGAEILSTLSGDHDRTRRALDRLTDDRGLLRGLFSGRERG